MVILEHLDKGVEVGDEGFRLGDREGADVWLVSLGLL